MATRGSRPGFFSRLKTGWSLTKSSFGVLRDHPKLMVFPLLAGLSSIIFFVLLFLPMLVAELVSDSLVLVVLFALYFATTFASTYFTAGLIHASNEVFHGREPSVIDSLSAMTDRLGPIFVWSLISATVSILLRKLEQSDSPAAGLLRSVFAIGWSIMTFFIVPTIVFQGGSVTGMFKDSGRAFKETWGENIGASFGITGIIFVIGLLLFIAAVVVAVVVGTAFPTAGTAIGIVLVLLAITFTYLLSQTVWGIVKTALYVYADDGFKPEQFEGFDFETLGGRTEQSTTGDRAGTANTLSDD